MARIEAMTSQQTIAHYRILAKLGEGGMGEVWRATDTKLNRDVAIKILPDAFAQDADRMARFTREAQVLASLNHPNIAAIYGVEERALVMELVPGTTLAERIAQGPIALEETLPIAIQIAEAVEYAHERGIVHRDLKPANVKITPEGRVKVLDFGLAKAMSTEAAAANPASSPTLSMRATVAGVIMGTAAYMSPEQASGKTVDKRADIWSFGVVLWEMLIGCPLFSGETISHILADVLRAEIGFNKMPPGTPAAIRELLRRCLDRDVKNRLRDIGEARIALQKPVEIPSPAPDVNPRQSRMPWIAAAAAVLAALVLAAALWRGRQPTENPLVRLSVDLGPDALLGNRSTAILSPDGTRIVYPARGPNGQQQLATRLLNQPQAVLLAGTEQAADPFFSPDGQWIGFFANGQIKKVAAEGGAVVALCDALDERGASWGADGSIVAAPAIRSGLIQFPDKGGSPQVLTDPPRNGEATHRWPQILPGGKAVLFTASKQPANYAMANVDALILETGRIKVVQRGGYFGRYLAGYLVYLSQGKLFAVRFNSDRVEVTGNPVPLLDDVAERGISGSGLFDLSAGPAGHGTFVYLNGNAGASTRGWPIVWLDSSGKIESFLAGGTYMNIRLSPDGKRMVFTDSADLFVFDSTRDTSTRLTFFSSGVSALRPVWTADGKHLAFSSQRSGGTSLQWIRADGAGQPQTLLESQNELRPYSFSPDGKYLAFSEATRGTSYEIWMLPIDSADTEHPKAGKAEPFLQTRFQEDHPAFSPDGRWIAYSSTESGRREIYVRPFPAGRSGGTGRSQISSAGGTLPIWSRRGRELYYEGLDNRIMVASYSTQADTFVPEKPRLWSETQLINLTSAWNLDLAPDGKRFVILANPDPVGDRKGTVHVTFLLNFLDELRRKLP